MRAALAVAAVIPFLLLTTGAAASKCMTRSEAKTMNPRAHLYWSVGPGGRCWASSLQAARASARGLPMPRAASAPVQPVTSHHEEPGSRASRLGALPVPVELPGLMPPHQDTPAHLEENPRWSWITEARAAERDVVPEIVYSTFDGEPPDVWPTLPVSPASTTSGGFFIVVLSAVLAMVFGMMFARWHQRRLRWRG